MRDLDELSGRWTGFWIQGGDRGHMGLTLNFAKGKISGEGLDTIGSFSMKGAYGLDGAVTIKKRYRWHTVHYSGNWDGSMIHGQWEIKWFDAGEFEIWPEKDDVSFIADELEQTVELSLPAPTRAR